MQEFKHHFLATIGGQHARYGCSNPWGLAAPNPARTNPKTFFGRKRRKFGMTTIGQHFEQMRQTSEHTMEDALYSVSMGEYRYASRKDERFFHHWKQLFRHCRAWVDEHAAGPYVPYKTESDVMNAGKDRLWAVEKQRVPQSWMRVIFTLKELAGSRKPSAHAKQDA